MLLLPSPAPRFPLLLSLPLCFLICPPSILSHCQTPHCPCFQSACYFCLPSSLSSLHLPCLSHFLQFFLSETTQTTALSQFLNCQHNLTFLECSSSVEVVVPQCVNTPDSSSPSACTRELKPFSLSSLHSLLISLLSSSAKNHDSRLTFDHSPWELFIAERQVFYLCCVTIQL